MDKQSKAPGVYRVILCVLTLALAPVFYAIWQPYNTCLLQLPATGGVWQLLTRLLYYVLFSLLLAGICRSSLGPKTVAPFGAKPWLRTVGGVLAARLVLDLVIYGGSFLLPVDLVRQSGQLAFLLFAFWWAARCAGLTAAVGKGSRVWVASPHRRRVAGAAALRQGRDRGVWKTGGLAGAGYGYRCAALRCALRPFFSTAGQLDYRLSGLLHICLAL